MFRVVQKVGVAFQLATRQTLQCQALAASGVRYAHGGPKETDDEFNDRYISYFNRADGWMVRKAMNDLHGMDLVPEPKVVIASLRACRRLNDYALAVRYLESIQRKCVTLKEIWPYMNQELKPTLEELGILTPEQMGYDKPELAQEDVYSM